MIIAASVDDKYGMMFNKRRQSQDSKVREHLLGLCAGMELRMNAYSLKQFKELPKEEITLCVDEEFLDNATENSICFVENRSVSEYREQIEKIILYKWNRNYPGDFYFDFPLAELGWKCTVLEEFAGTSHEKITVEEWTR